MILPNSPIASRKVTNCANFHFRSVAMVYMYGGDAPRLLLLPECISWQDQLNPVEVDHQCDKYTKSTDGLNLSTSSPPMTVEASGVQSAEIRFDRR